MAEFGRVSEIQSQADIGQDYRINCTVRRESCKAQVKSVMVDIGSDTDRGSWTFYLDTYTIIPTLGHFSTIGASKMGE